MYNCKSVNCNENEKMVSAYPGLGAISWGSRCVGWSARGLYICSDSQKAMEWEDNILGIWCYYKANSTNLVKWVCLHCTIAVSHAYWTFKSYILILKVVFLFPSCLVNTAPKFPTWVSWFKVFIDWLRMLLQVWIWVWVQI